MTMRRALAVLAAVAVVTSLSTVRAQAPATAPQPGTKPAVRKQVAPAVAPSAKPRQAPTASPSTPPPAFAIGPLPSWFAPVEVPTGAPSQPAPMHVRLIDEQLRVTDTGTTAAWRIVRAVSTTAGLQQASTIEIEFDPNFEQLTLHHLDVVRNGQRSSRLARDKVQLLRRERQLEQQLYDGRLTATVVLDDVRAGDDVDFAYSIEGRNPVFGQRFVHRTQMRSWRGPTSLYRVRLLAPADRAIGVQTVPRDAVVESGTSGPLRETTFSRRQVAQFAHEPGITGAALWPDTLQFSEFDDWASVAAWGRQLFGEGAGPQTQALAAAIASRLASPGDRVLEALRIVQQDVRYFGVEMGAASHRPSPPDRVLGQRFGDCKDKVALFAALLKELGIEASPVLVSTELRSRVEASIPTPLAFNHVIARVVVDGQAYWLDPTRDQQSGRLQARQALGFGFGLPLVTGADRLVAMPERFDSEPLRVDDRIVVARFQGEPVLESRIQVRGDLAEANRALLAGQGLRTLVDTLNTGYLRTYPSLRQLDEPRIEQSTEEDGFTLVQRFAVPGLWRFPEERALVADVALWGALEPLIPPKVEARRHPLWIAFPGIYRHRVRVEFGEAVYERAGSRSDEAGDQHFRMSSRVEGARDAIEFNAETRVLATEIAPERWSSFLATLNKAAPLLQRTVGVGAVGRQRSDALTAELKRLDDDVRNGKIARPRTAVQREAVVRDRVLTAALDDQRLPPSLRAQALVARGIARDNVGNLGAGERDFQAALDLAPDSADALNGAATNAQSQGQTDRAIELATRLLSRQPRDLPALLTRARAAYLAGRYVEARRDLEAALAEPGAVERGYPMIWLALTLRRMGENAGDLLQRYPAAAWPGDWPRPVLMAVVAGGDTDDVIAQAAKSKSPLETQVEAYAYLGERLAADGKAQQARVYWQRAVDLGVHEFVEHHLSRQRLAEGR